MKDMTIDPFQKALLAWFDVHRRPMPWREEKTPYRVWISEVMLQQTRVDTVIPYFERFLAWFPSLEALADATEDRLLKAWEGMGYYNRVRNLKKAAGMIRDQYGGTFPESAEAWAELPGIGPYASGSIVSIAFDTPVPAVDGNVSRVLARVEGLRSELRDSESKNAIRALAIRLLPEVRVGDFNQSLMELGALVCLPNGKPLCGLCPIAGFCEARRLGIEETIPPTAPKTAVATERRTVFLLENNHGYAIRKRPVKGLLAGMWEFPHVEGHLSIEEAKTLLEGWGCSILGLRKIGEATHHFSHKTWKMTGIYGRVDGCSENFVFADAGKIGSEYALPTAFRFYQNQIKTEKGK